jgi:hypothetical protein
VDRRSRKRCPAIRNFWTATVRAASRSSDSSSTPCQIWKTQSCFAKKIGVRYPLAVAADDLKQKFGGIEGLPTTLLYNRQGVLREKVIGFEYTDTIEAQVKPLL